MESKYYVYNHIRPDTGDIFYIGIGKEGTDRINHKRRNSIWKNIVNKNNGIYIKEKICENLTLKEVDQIEIYLIKFYGRIKYNEGPLANILEGGHCNKDYRKLTPEEKEILRQNFIGNKYAAGIKWTEERKQRHIKQRTGKSTNRKGFKASEETKNKQSLAHKGNLSNTGKIFINNSIISTLINKDELIPDGFKLGRIITWKITGRPKKIK